MKDGRHACVSSCIPRCLARPRQQPSAPMMGEAGKNGPEEPVRRRCHRPRIASAHSCRLRRKGAFATQAPAEAKAKVKRAIEFIQAGFLPGRDLSNGLMDARRQLDEWVAETNARVRRSHGEIVDERFAREAPLLTPVRITMRLKLAGLPVRVAHEIAIALLWVDERCSRYGDRRIHSSCAKRSRR